jgi:hypothetical protein
VWWSVHRRLDDFIEKIILTRIFILSKILSFTREPLERPSKLKIYGKSSCAQITPDQETLIFALTGSGLFANRNPDKISLILDRDHD